MNTYVPVFEREDLMSHFSGEHLPEGEFADEQLQLFYDTVQLRRDAENSDWGGMFFPRALLGRDHENDASVVEILHRNVSEFWRDMLKILNNGFGVVGIEQTFRDWMIVMSLFPLSLHVLIVFIFVIFYAFMAIIQRPIGAAARRMFETNATPTKLLMEIALVSILIGTALLRILD